VRILVYEFVSGGGLAGRDVPFSLGREGAAMLTALVADLAAIGGHQIVTTADARFPHTIPRGVEVVTLPSARQAREALLDGLMASADAVWLVAPETDRCLERLAAKAERQRTPLLGASAEAIRRASDKAGLPRRLADIGVRHPTTRALRPGADWARAAREVGYPVVVKPARGAGCHGVCLARSARELRRAVAIARRASGAGLLLLQQYVAGRAASVSLLADGRGAVPLAVNAQSVRSDFGVRSSRPLSYHGGRTPFDHPLASQAIKAAIGTCQALPGLRGFVGVDVVLTSTDAVVIEVNPRLTTAYLGVRSALEENVAALALAACAGVLPAPLSARRRVRFTAAGRIVSTEPYASRPGIA
jgi:predicted ATP-grasp superfamily ATP-dependent carboligase